MVKKDKRARQVDYHSTTDYADGRWFTNDGGWTKTRRQTKLNRSGILLKTYLKLTKLLETTLGLSLFNYFVSFLEIKAQVFETSSLTGENVGEFKKAWVFKNA